MDRILKANNDSPDHYKVAKQADVLMTWYVLAPEEVARILRQLGYTVEDEIELLRRNYEYYEPRTSHGSTLSKVVHAVVASYTHQADAVWDWFTEAMRSDIYDTQGGTTVEGIHCGVMAGTIDVIRRYFAGININDHGQIVVEPDLPVHWKSLTLKLKYRKVWYDFRFNHDQVSVSVAGNGNKPTDIIVCGKELDIRSGQEKTCELKQPEGN
jgi:trehalose/maltose hydrolase-like predicted phosphorylase